MNDNEKPRGVQILEGLMAAAGAKLPGDHDSMSPEEIKEWNAFLAKEADEEEQRMMDYD